MHPKITIIMPSYNQGNFLEAAIRSVVTQQYPNLEYIVIDGGSTDHSVEIIRKYEHQISYWVSEKDTGQADALNKGLRRSTGQIIGWLNSDDAYLPKTLFKVARAFKRNPECIVVHGERVLIDSNGSTIGWTALRPFDPQVGGFNVCSETAFWRKEAGERIGKFNADLRFAMDLEYFCRLYQVGKFLKLNDYLGCFRCHADSKSSTIWNVGRQEAEREWKRLFGTDNENWNVRPDRDLMRLISALIHHPRSLTLPYLSYRFSRRESA